MRNLVILKCQECKDIFSVIPYRARTGRAKYCSLECKYKNMDYKIRQGESKNCLNCDKQYYVFPSRVKKGESKFCSVKCRSIGNLGKFLGENNWNWKGDQAGYQAKHTWIRRMLGAPSKCEYCGTTDKNRTFNWANKSHKYKRTLTDWLRLCKKCHKKYDDVYGQSFKAVGI